MGTEIKVDLALVNAQLPLRAVGFENRNLHTHTDNVHSEWKTCPHCGAELTKRPESARIERALLDARTFVGTKSTTWRKAWVK
jgi:hypothetical protein